MKTDILIVGSGCSGLYCALNLPVSRQITVITKAGAEENDSYLAQGGMCMLKDESDYQGFFDDTMKAGHLGQISKRMRMGSWCLLEREPIQRKGSYFTRM